MMAFLRSCSPPSIFLISPPSTRPANSSMPADSSASTSSPWPAQSMSTPRSSALRLQRGDQLDFFLDTAPPLEGFLRFDLIVPEVGRRGAGFYLGKLVALGVRPQR